MEDPPPSHSGRSNARGGAGWGCSHCARPWPGAASRHSHKDLADGCPEAVDEAMHAAVHGTAGRKQASHSRTGGSVLYVG